ncbi:MAG TPA: plasma-membrane proton-efflux P-type ATPase, partial [Methanobacterium sp.]|nr:plasma-membrane proton-efflux P-type ATPase [Methanobacterium sp.]
MDKKVINADEAKKSSLEELLKKLSSDKGGISSSEAQKRLQEYGSNEISEKKVNPLVKFIKYFWGPMPWLIEVAIILSAAIQHWADLGIISALLILNAVVGFWQEYKASNAIELLKEKLALKARVLRDGKWLEISAKELVPGDIVHMGSGDIVPADAKIMDGISADESSLTGESLPVDKNASDIAYSGSVVNQGETNALVTSTGMNTYFGKTAQLVEKAQTRSFLQKTVVKIGDYLIILAVIMVATIFIVALFRHESFFETLQFALVLVVASIPVALPAVLSVTMAVGAVALAKKEAIVSKLVAIEEMAGVDVLCADKTGTITKNELKLGEIKPFDGFKEDDILLYGRLASPKDSKDPIDVAVLSKAREKSVKIKGYKIAKFKPFDPVSKRTEASIASGSKHFKVSKGATQVILSLTGEDKKTADKMNEYVNKFAEKGYRTLGVAITDESGKWQYAGLFGLYDPPREDSAETIKTAESMGVDVKMVTGDHVAIAKEISREVNLGTKIIIPKDFADKPDRKAKKVVEETDGFAEVFPEHKYHIVELLQDKGHIVGMTGDGVNDSPALKKANVGIAVAGATDAAKSAASIVLTQPGISVIIDSIKQSRKIFQRMNNYSIYRIAETVRVLFFISLSIIFFNFYPVTALMIVLLALLNDAPIMTIAYDNVIYSNEPEKWDLRIILGIATMLGIIGVISSFFILYIGLNVFNLSPYLLQSFIYLKLSVAGHMTVFVARTKGHFWSVKPALPLFLAVVITQTIATLIVVYGFLLPAIGWGLAAFIWGYALIAFVITD